MIIVSSRSDHRVRKGKKAARLRGCHTRYRAVPLAILAADRMEFRIVRALSIRYSLIAEKSSGVVDIADIADTGGTIVRFRG